jgi:hypothetical protein
MRLDEGVLRGLLGVLARAADGERDPKRCCLVSAHDLLVGVDVPTLRALDEVLVGARSQRVAWSAHHTSFYNPAARLVPKLRDGLRYRQPRCLQN